jgi:hypothetical protein
VTHRRAAASLHRFQQLLTLLVNPSSRRHGYNALRDSTDMWP